MIAYQNLSGFTEIWYQGRQVQEVYSNTSKVWPTNIKFSATYIGGQTYSTECNGDTELSLSETKPSGYEYSAMTTAEIGDCVTSIGGSAFYQCTSLTSVIIPNSVTSIGVWAFMGCTSLTSINIPSDVTSIGDMTFNSCSSLTSVNIPSGVTSIGVYAFSNCTSLTSITVNATVPPTLGDYVFGNTNDCPIYVPCESVEAYKTAWTNYADRIQCVEPFGGKFKATYSGGQTYSADCDGSPILTSSETIPSGYQITAMTTAEIGSCVTTIGDYALSSHSGLTSITIPISVTSISEAAFRNCSSLTGVTIPSGVTSIGNFSFFRCTSLTSITIPNSVQTIGGSVFYECSRLTSITIGNGVQTIGNSLFLSCISLQSVTIPSGVTSIGGWAFYHCSSLTSITCNATTPPSLGSEAFDNTNNCPIYVPSGSVETYKTASGWSTYADRIQAIP